MANEYESDRSPQIGQIPEMEPLESFEYEEFDISKFDFTIHDPGDPGQESPSPAPEPEPISEPEPERPVIPEPEVMIFPEQPEPEQDRSRTKKEKPAAPAPKKRRGISVPDLRSLDRKLVQSKAKRYLRYALRPAGLYENISEAFWPLFLAGSCLFGGGLYLLVGMDWARTDLITFGRMWAFVLAGLLVGGIAALTFAGGTALLGRICKSDGIRPFRMLSTVAGAAVFPGAVLLFGLFAGIFGASVSMSFGVIALLWWIYALMEVLRDLLGERYAVILSFITVWGTGLFALISLTFSLK